VNAAIEAAHRRGILTAASLMIGAPEAPDAIARAQALPNLRVGLHVVLVDGEPVADRAQIPGLLDGSGRLRNDLASYGARIAFDASLRRQLETEIGAQFEAYRATGLPLSHVDGHRHFQLHPAVAALIIRVGRRYGMRALRVPVEPWRVVAQIDPQTQRMSGRIVAPLAAWLRRRVRRAGLTTADAVFGLAWSGAMTKSRLAALLGRLPPGLVEIYTHPATANVFDGAAKGYRYEEEFSALCDADCIDAARRSGYALGGYSDAVAF
jgi:hopanoid biosynthesis associated protein HpnK